MSSNGNHPLPPAPGQYQQPLYQQPQQYQQPQRPAGRERSKTSFSFKSTHSHKSSGSGGQKIDLTETHAEKESHRLQSKADPSMAITEAEPSAVASTEKTSLAPIRAIQHLDKQGNPIADPDRSNPTRSRWERPLDTIRAFEAAIDGNYSRKSYTPNGSTPNMNRRSSYFGDNQSQYGSGRPQSYRPESYMDGRPNGPARPDSYYNGGENAGNAGPSNGYYPNRARYPRTASEPHFAPGHGVYPPHGNPQSYETVTTASGSGSSAEPAGYMTDPSSENSSLDRIAPAPAMDNYGYDGQGNNSQYFPPGNGHNEYGAQRQGNGYPAQGPPALPRKESSGPRIPIKLGTTSGNAGPKTYEPPRPAAPEKRKSWFGKRFSKNS